MNRPELLDYRLKQAARSHYFNTRALSEARITESQYRTEDIRTRVENGLTDAEWRQAQALASAWLDPPPRSYKHGWLWNASADLAGAVLRRF